MSIRDRAAAAIWALNGAIAAAALGLYLGAVHELRPLSDAVALPWWVLAAGFAVAELAVVHIHFRRSAHSLSFGELPLILGLLFVAPRELIVAQLLGCAAALLLSRRHSALRLAFNLGQYTLLACIAVVVFRALAPASGQLEPRLWLATVAATLIAGVAGALLVGAVLSISEAALRPRELLQTVASSAVVTLTNTGLGLAGAAVVATDSRNAWLLLAPAATVFLAYRAYTSERKKHQRLEFLHEATRTLSRSPEVVPALTGLLKNTIETFGAELAEVVLLPSEPGKPPMRTTLGPGSVVELMRPVETEVAEELRALVDREAPAVVLSPPFPGGSLERYLAARGVERAMLAALPGETRLVGTMMLGNRPGVEGDFGTEDLKLFETLANQTGVSLDHDRLEHVVWQLNELKDQLAHQAYHDPLTGLANRTLFLERVDRALADADRPVAVMLLDLDDFKTVNDTLGHAVGDDLLVAVAERLRHSLRASDVPARLGGDEFAVLLERLDEAALTEAAGRIMEAIESPFQVSGERLSIHASLGIASRSDGAERTDELLRNADVAMYSAKSSGKRRYKVFEPRMHAAVAERHALKEQLARAVERDELELSYQPIVNLRTGATVAVEALVRWNDPQRGVVFPRSFIPLAEETGLILPVGRLVLDHVTRDLRAWRDDRPADEARAVHMNVSALELEQPDFVAKVAAALDAAEVPADRLVLEITESALMHDAQLSLKRLGELKELGVRLALDDFGTGYSSLSHLRWFPFDMLKIAKSFVDDIARGPEDHAFVRMMRGLAGALGVEVIAEGIESPEQAALLLELECEMGQGFYFARPGEVAAQPSNVVPIHAAPVAADLA